MEFSTIIDWLDAHSGAATVLSTLVLALITALYVFITYQLVRQGRRALFEPRLRRELSTEGEGLFHLEVRSLGPGIATGVVLRCGPARATARGFRDREPRHRQ